jgi:hypothetical protein
MLQCTVEQKVYQLPRFKKYKYNVGFVSCSMVMPSKKRYLITVYKKYFVAELEVIITASG